MIYAVAVSAVLIYALWFAYELRKAPTYPDDRRKNPENPV